MDEHKAIRDRSRALGAQSLLDNELLKEAFDQLEAEYMRTWRETNILNQVGREKLFLAVNVIGKVREHLKSIVDDGKIAEKDLMRLAQDEERKKRFGIIG